MPTDMFANALQSGRIVRPFETCVSTGSYWLTWLKSREETAAMQCFRKWLLHQFTEHPDAA